MLWVPETWFTSDDADKVECTPNGCILLDHPWPKTKLHLVIIYWSPKLLILLLRNFFLWNVLSSERLLITGDCNIHIDLDDHDAIKLLDLLQSLAIEQHVSILDLITILSLPTSGDLFSDHFLVLYKLKSHKTWLTVKEVSFRKINSLDFRFLRKAYKVQNTPSQLDKSVKSYKFMLAVALLLMKVWVITLCVP